MNGVKEKSTDNKHSVQSEIELLTDEIQNYYHEVNQFDSVPRTSPAEIRTYLKGKYNFNEKQPLNQITADLIKMMRKWSVHSASRKYFGLFVPGTSLASVIADSLVALYNPQLGVWSHAPVSVEIEKHVLSFLLEKFGFDPSSSSANFTTGGTEANLSAVLAALNKSFPIIREKGIRKIKTDPVFYVSQDAHHSFVKIAQIIGLGSDSVRLVETDNEHRMDIARLKEQYKKDLKNNVSPFMVAATAGSTSTGAIDQLKEVAKFCQNNNLWFHVDAAWGGAAILSTKLKKFINGIEKADSITCDAHKWLSVSMAAGMFFCKHKKIVEDVFRVFAPYLPHKVEETDDPAATTIQCSRRFIGLKLFIALSEIGVEGYSERLDKNYRLCNLLREKLILSGWEIVNSTPLPVICFTHRKFGNNSETVEWFLEKIYERGNVWISSTLLKDQQRVLRASITNFRTKFADVGNLVQELNCVLNDLH